MYPFRRRRTKTRNADSDSQAYLRASLGREAGLELPAPGETATDEQIRSWLEWSGAEAGAADARREAHERIAQPLLSPIAAMIGFATLMIGGYSRFGVWRQVLWAILGLIGVQMLTNAAANQAGRDPALWPVLYLPAVLGAGLCCGLLWWAGRPRRLRRRRAAA